MSQPNKDLVNKAHELEAQGLSTTQIAYEMKLTENRVEKLLDLEGDLSFPERRPVESPQGTGKSSAAAKSDGKNGKSRARHGAAFGEIVVLPRVKTSSEGRKPGGYVPTGRPNGLRKDLKPAECGTVSGYNKHLRDKTTTCQPCRDAKNKAKKAAEAKRRENINNVKKAIEELQKEFTQHPNSRPNNNHNPTGNNGREPAKHGTMSGYARHVKDKTEVCPECREALAKDSERRKKEREEEDMREVISLRREIEAIQKVLEESHKPFTTNSGRVICNADLESWPCKMIRDVKAVRDKAAKGRNEINEEFNTNTVVMDVEPELIDSVKSAFHTGDES